MLSDVILPITPSATVAIFNRAKEKGINQKVFNFAAGDPQIVCDAHIISCAEKEIDTGKCCYPPLRGIPLLRSLATEWMNTSYHANYCAEECLVTPGGKMALYLTLQALIRPDDEVLILSPYWVSYPEMIKLFGGKPVVVPCLEKNGWKVELGKLSSAVTAKTKALLINNACNPTGVLYTREEISVIVDFAIKNKLCIISDEVYSEMVYAKGSFISFSSLSPCRDNLVVIQSCSKNFGMTGWRVGFAFAPKKFIDALSLLASQSITATSFAAQHAAIGALENKESLSAHICTLMKKRRDLFFLSLKNHFAKDFLLPPSSLYLFVSLKQLGIEGMDCTTFCERLLEEGCVAAVPGIAFGCEGYVRFAFGESEEDIKQGVEALAKACKEIGKKDG